MNRVTFICNEEWMQASYSKVWKCCSHSFTWHRWKEIAQQNTSHSGQKWSTQPEHMEETERTKERRTTYLFYSEASDQCATIRLQNWHINIVQMLTTSLHNLFDFFLIFTEEHSEVAMIGERNNLREELFQIESVRQKKKSRLKKKQQSSSLAPTQLSFSSWTTTHKNNFNFILNE